MTKDYLAHVHVISTEELTEEQMNELFSYLEVQIGDAIIRVELSHYEQI